MWSVVPGYGSPPSAQIDLPNAERSQQSLPRCAGVDRDSDPRHMRGIRSRLASAAMTVEGTLVGNDDGMAVIPAKATQQFGVTDAVPAARRCADP
jgi:hypothetical protein